MPSQQEYAAAVSHDAYYRRVLYQLGKTNAESNVHRNRTCHVRGGPEPRCVPLAEVREEDIARIAKYKWNPTPKVTDAHREAERKHCVRVSEAAEAMALWNRLDHPCPVQPDQPRIPAEGFDGAAIEIENRGRDITRKAVEVSQAAAYNQWRSITRLERKRYGEDCSVESPYREYYQAVADYVERWKNIQEEVGRRFADDKARGKGRNDVK